jgi:ABC-type multidrug transport system ATPase subunit
MTVIEARGLRKAFGSTIALDGVDLRVEEGRILGLIGPNGAGKSTALNAILGLTSYQGELQVLGRDLGRSEINSCATSVSLPMLPSCRAGFESTASRLRRRCASAI